jgi:hypothetical protein
MPISPIIPRWHPEVGTAPMRDVVRISAARTVSRGDAPGRHLDRAVIRCTS